MKYVFQQSALLQEELQPDPEPALATEELLEPLCCRKLTEKWLAPGLDLPDEQRPEVPVILLNLIRKKKSLTPQDLRYYVEVQIEDWGRNRDRLPCLKK